MEKIESKLTVFFENPFWVGVYECEVCGKYEVCKITFVSEPKDYVVYEFFLKNFNQLRLSLPIKVSIHKEKHINPKRMLREVNRQLSTFGVGTKAQQALKLQHEQNKLERKSNSHIYREAEKERQFQLKQEKRKEKHRGH